MNIVSIVPILNTRNDARINNTAMTIAQEKLHDAAKMGYNTTILEEHLDDLEEDYLDIMMVEHNLIKEARTCL